MIFFDILKLALRNLREAKLRVSLTTIGVVVGVTVIVTMVSFGLGLQRNAVQRFKDLDLFNELTVSGRDISEIVAQVFNRATEQGSGGGGDGRRRNRPNSPPMPDKPATRVLDDAALAEIARIPGVEAVEPTLQFTAYVRANQHTQPQSIGGALVPNPASRFKGYAAGHMISSATADEVVVDEKFVKDFGFAKAADAVGQTIELLAPPGAQKRARADEQHGGAGNDDNAKRERTSKDKGQADDFSFFGLSLGGDDGADALEAQLPVRTFRIAGVLKDEVESGGPNGRQRFRGLMPAARIYVPLAAAREWGQQYRDPLNEVALQLARQSGAINEQQAEGYSSAVVRVNDPDVLTDVRKRLTELGFSSFSIVDELEEIRTAFLVINSSLGLLGGISLLVASFGIANTMVMSILERTREIGIMKAIGAEDREIKLIFFVEAGLIGLAGGVIGALAAWGIDVVANRLAYRFLLKPRGVSFISFFSLPPYLWLGAILFAIVISIIAALYPAARAARIDPVRALRHD